jgi:Flp pilus assembly protein TadD
MLGGLEVGRGACATALTNSTLASNLRVKIDQFSFVSCTMTTACYLSENQIKIQRYMKSTSVKWIALIGVACSLAPFNVAVATGAQKPIGNTASQSQQEQTERTRNIQNQMSLGYDAFQQGNSAAALAAFDAADRLAGGYLYLNPELHAMRAATFNAAGRNDTALREARIAFDYLNEGPLVTKELRDRFFATNQLVDLDLVYAAVTVIFKKNNDVRFEPSLRALLSRSPTDAPGWSNRGALLGDLERHSEAVVASQRAVRMEPNNPLVLNNHCFILTQAGRANEGLPVCAKAIRLAPNISPIRSSYSTTLAKLGRCTEAAEQKAIALRLDPNSEEALKPLECTRRR